MKNRFSYMNYKKVSFLCFKNQQQVNLLINFNQYKQLRLTRFQNARNSPRTSIPISFFYMNMYISKYIFNKFEITQKSVHEMSFLKDNENSLKDNTDAVHNVIGKIKIKILTKK